MAQRTYNTVINITNSGGTFDIDAIDGVSQYLISGSPTLTSSVSITSSNVSGKTWSVFYCLYVGSINLNSNTFTFFGQQVPQQYLTRNAIMIAIYNGSDFNVFVNPNLAQSGKWIALGSVQDGAIDEDALATDAVSTDKIQDEAVVPEKLSEEGQMEVITAIASFDAGRQGAYRVYIPYKCDAISALARVTDELGATDSGTITFATASGNIGSGAITLPAEAAFGSEQVAVFTAPNQEIAVDSYIQYTTAKTTGGGEAALIIFVRRKS